MEDESAGDSDYNTKGCYNTKGNTNIKLKVTTVVVVQSMTMIDKDDLYSGLFKESIVERSFPKRIAGLRFARRYRRPRYNRVEAVNSHKIAILYQFEKEFSMSQMRFNLMLGPESIGYKRYLASIEWKTYLVYFNECYPRQASVI